MVRRDTLIRAAQLLVEYDYQEEWDRHDWRMPGYLRDALYWLLKDVCDNDPDAQSEVWNWLDQKNARLDI